MVVRALLASFCAMSIVFAAPTWTQISAPPFEILTDAGEKVGRRVLERFEQARRAFDENGSAPLRILVFSRERDFARFRPNDITRAFFQSGPERGYIAMTYGGPSDPLRVVMHEYTHSVLNHRVAALPRWLEEGLAEFYSTVTVWSGRLSIGGAIESSLRSLQQDRTLLSAKQLTAVDHDSPYYSEASKSGIFYAQSWALTHMLYFDPRYRAGLAKYVEAAGRAADPVIAFQEIFGRSLDQALVDLQTYIDHVAPAVEVTFDDTGRGVARVSVISEPEAAAAKGELLLLLGRTADAQTLYTKLERDQPKSPIAQEGLGSLALRANDYEAARLRFARAVELGAADGAVFFEYAMLLRDTGAPREQVTEMLNQTLKVSPGFAEAHFLLGVRASDDGEFAEAAEHLRRACELLPRQSYFWHALAFAYHKLGRAELSRDAAYRARNAARNVQEAGMALAALRLSDATSSAPVKAAVITPRSWDNPKGDTQARGHLTRVDCENDTARLQVDGLTLTVADPTRVLIKGTGGATTTLVCGPQDLRVVVDYIAGSGSVTAIEFQ